MRRGAVDDGSQDSKVSERLSEQPPLLFGHSALLGRQYLNGDVVGAGFKVLADSSDDRVDAPPGHQSVDEGVAATRGEPGRHR